MGSQVICQLDRDSSQLINIVKISHIFIFINYRYFQSKYNQQIWLYFMSVTHRFRSHRLNSGLLPLGSQFGNTSWNLISRKPTLLLIRQGHSPLGGRFNVAAKPLSGSHGAALTAETSGSYCHTTLSHSLFCKYVFCLKNISWFSNRKINNLFFKYVKF